MIVNKTTPTGYEEEEIVPFHEEADLTEGFYIILHHTSEIQPNHSYRPQKFSDAATTNDHAMFTMYSTT